MLRCDLVQARNTARAARAMHPLHPVWVVGVLTALATSGCPALVGDAYTDRLPPSSDGASGGAAGHGVQGGDLASGGGLSGGGEAGGAGGSGSGIPAGGARADAGGALGAAAADGGGSDGRGGGGIAGALPHAAGAAGSAGGSVGPLVPDGYAYRRGITVTAGAAEVPAAYTICVNIDHSGLVGSVKSRTDGSDVRVFHLGDAGLEEIDRALAPDTSWGQRRTEVCFATREPIAVGQSDRSYALYYGSYTAGDPPEDADRVFDVLESFDDGVLAPAWTLARIGSATGSVDEVEGTAVISGATGNIWDSADDFLFFERPRDGGFRIETCVTSSGGAESSIAKLGGVMVRQSLDRGSAHRTIIPVPGTQSRVTHYRLAPGTMTEAAAVTGTNPLPECYAMTRFGDWTRTFYKKEGAANWTELGTETRFTAPLTDPVLVGIPFANVMATEGWVSADWLLIIKYVEPEPTVALARESLL